MTLVGVRFGIVVFIQKVSQNAQTVAGFSCPCEAECGVYLPDIFRKEELLLGEWAATSYLGWI
jgi:hypothetical protein